MKAISEDSIRTLSGERAFERGVTYYNEGRVSELQINQARIEAVVEGSRRYHVTLHHTAKLFEGECDCPASNNFDFCKHCVATALKYYYQTQTNQELADSNSDSLLLNYLQTLTKPELAKALNEQLLKDDEALDIWQLKAEISSGGLSGASIRKRITKAIPYKPSGLWRYRDVAMYFEQTELALNVLAEPLLALPPSEASKLVRYAAQRLEKTLETVDDSGGYRMDTQTLIQEWSKLILNSDQWQANSRTKFVLDVLLDKNYSYTASDLLPLSLIKLDEEQSKAVYQNIEAEWLKLTPENPEHSPEQYYYERLERLLLDHARDKRAFDKELKILERGAVSVSRCLNLVEVCIEHQRLDDANKWLNYASKIKQLSVSEVYQIESTQISLYKAEGRVSEALDLEWNRFDEQESPELLSTLLKTARLIDQEKPYLDKAIKVLNRRLTKTDLSQTSRQRAETLVGLHLEYGQLKSAIALTRTSLLRSEWLMRIVDASSEINGTTFSLLERAVNLHVNATGQHVYEDAVKFLTRQYQRFGESHKAQFQKSLKAIFSEPRNLRKKNFISLLKAAFPEQFA